MNKEVGYIWQGFLLMLVVVTGIGIVGWLLSVKPPPEQKVVIDWVDVAPDYNTGGADGAALFKDNCATCHRVDKDLTGPALRGVEDRVRDKKLLYSWIRNSAAVLKKGNPYFTNLYNAYNQTPMTIFPSITDKEIEAILMYTKDYKAPPALASLSIISCQ